MTAEKSRCNSGVFIIGGSCYYYVDDNHNMTQDQALQILKTGANVFLTGEPGSGKTHTINLFVSYLRAHLIEPAITASTGIAATHIGGMTIHSWSGIGIKSRLSNYELDEISSNEYIVKRLRRAKILIIDEVSMLLPETLSSIDAISREVRQSREPFGGLQVIFVGDFFQLPPVTKRDEEEAVQTAMIKEVPARFAYDSPAWARAKPLVCYLTEQYRQDDDNYLAVLSAIRHGVFGDEHLRRLESRKVGARGAPEQAPKLFSHNIDVDRVNDEMLAQLPDASRKFIMSARGRDRVVETLKKSCLSPEMLALKIGAAVMFTKNNPKEGFANGTLGTVSGFNRENNHPIVKTRGGRQIEVEPMDWMVEDNGKILGEISQLPLRLAWAITVHKSQGMSMDEAVMDLSRVFEFGQGYVALSRVRRLRGLYLLGWNERAFQVHPEALTKDSEFHADSEVSEITFSRLPPDELQKMQDNFIIALGGHLKAIDEQNLCPREKRQKKGDTYAKTLALWNEGKNLQQIVNARGLGEQTIFGHLEQLAAKGKIDRVEILKRLFSPALFGALAKIHAVFRELDTTKLSPVFERLNGAYSYNDLRIARMVLKQ